MPLLDVFAGDAFSYVTLTDALLKRPFQPGRIGSLGIFFAKGVPTTKIAVEEKDGRLALIANTPRGSSPSAIGQKKRTARVFQTLHLAKESDILADEFQGLRAFGSDVDTESIQAVINDRADDLRAMHEVTLEYQRAKALQGKVLDADGTQIYDLFTEFGVTQQSAELSLSADLRNQVVEAKRLSEYALGNAVISGWRAFCGDTFFDAILRADSVVESLKYQDGQMLRDDVRNGFQYGGVVWENYRGRMNKTSEVDPDAEASYDPFFPDDEAYLVPLVTGPLSPYKTYFAPADFVETVNQPGLPMYVKQAPDAQFQRFVKLHVQSNPLAICELPRAVIQLTVGS